MHEAEQYLRNPQNPPSLHVIIGGKKRRLFINRDQGQIGIVAPKKKVCGYSFSAWNTIEKICYPRPPRCPEEQNRRLVRKYQQMAARATFSSPYQRKVMKADPSKSLYENGVTTGVTIEGQVISLAAVEKWCGPYVADQFRDAVRRCKSFHSSRFNFRGYDGSLWVEPCNKTEEGYQEGDLRAGFCKEYRNCGNGYYYILIDDEHFIGYDID